MSVCCGESWLGHSETPGCVLPSCSALPLAADWEDVQITDLMYKAPVRNGGALFYIFGSVRSQGRHLTLLGAEFFFL